jgi:YjbE family integral membrane protein
MEVLHGADFWIGLLKIVWINIILSGDNAVVIAMAARVLPEHQQRKAVIVAARLLALPYLQIAGGLLLLWVGVQLLGNEDDTSGKADAHHGSLMAAVRTILIADLIMSVDNVIAVAAAAKGSTLLLAIGLALSIPLVIFGSTLMIRLMARFPIIVTLGAALIGWIGGETIVSDIIFKDSVLAAPWLHFGCAAAGAALVIALGKAIRAWGRRRRAA